MPSMEGGGVEKNLILIANYISKYKKKVCLITFDNSFNKYFDNRILIIYAKKKSSLKHLPLIKQSRLSVMPIDTKSWKIILKMGSIK